MSYYSQQNKQETGYSGVVDLGGTMSPVYTGYDDPPLRREEDRALPQQEGPNRDILIYDARGFPQPTVAHIDTGTSQGCWISRRKVLELGFGNRVDQNAAGPKMLSASGDFVESQGCIDLRWREPTGNYTIATPFQVFNASQYDIIFGQAFSQKYGLVSYKPGGMAPLASAARETPAQREQRERAERDSAAQRSRNDDTWESRRAQERDQRQRTQRGQTWL